MIIVIDCYCGLCVVMHGFSYSNRLVIYNYVHLFTQSSVPLCIPINVMTVDYILTTFKLNAEL